MAAVACYLVLTDLGGRQLAHSDEGHYVAAAYQAVSHDEWIVPLQQGKFFAHFGKPPLTYWLIALSTQLLGHSKSAFRLPTALAALLAWLLTIVLGEKIARNAGLVAGLLLLCSYEWAGAARRIWIEDLVILFDVAALLLYCHGREVRKWWPTLAAGILLALAIMAKQVAGAVGLAALVVTELLFLRTARWRHLVVLGALALTPFALYFAALTARIGLEQSSLLFSLMVFNRIKLDPGQVATARSYWDGLTTYLGTIEATFGLVACGALIRHPVSAGSSAAFLKRASLTYLVLTFIGYGILSKTFRAWWVYPSATFLAVAGGVAAVGLWQLARKRGLTETWIYFVLGATGYCCLAFADKSIDFLKAGVGVIVLMVAFEKLAQPRPMMREFAAWLCIAATLTGVAGLVVRESHRINIEEGRVDPVARWAATVKAGAPDIIMADGWYLKGEFAYYFEGAPLAEANRDALCTPAPEPLRYNYLAIDRAPDCWKKMKGRIVSYAAFFALVTTP